MQPLARVLAVEKKLPSRLREGPGEGDSRELTHPPLTPPASGKGTNQPKENEMDYETKADPLDAVFEGTMAEVAVMRPHLSGARMS